MENTLEEEFSFIAITPSLSPENLSLYINSLESFRRNINEIEFLIIRNKFLNSKEYRKLAKIIMKLLDGKLPCVLHFDNLDSFYQMDDLVSKSYGAHFTSSLLMKLEKDDLHKHIENEKIFGGSCHNEEEISFASNLGCNYCILGPIKDKLIDEKIVTRGIGWRKFSEMAKKSFIKTYAIGGLENNDFEIACNSFASGIAGISMFDQSS